MIRYIISKMMGAEGLLMLLPNDGWHYLWRAYIGLFSDYSCKS